jgi:asparagine synthase (glutamine-hydrolysing)
MCGIVGFFSRKDISLDLVKKMIASLNHRGPDDSDYFLDEKSNIFLGHTRLSILDISSNAKQPITSENHRYVMLFNGEIYNFKKLRNQLNNQFKINWKSHGDTEVLLNCFEKYGFKDTLKLLEGMYAIALYDRKFKKLYLVRDKFGEKPIYFGNSNGKFYFSSELKAMIIDNNFKKEINKLSVSYLMSYNYIPSPLSIYKNIYKIKHGHYVEIDLNSHKYENNSFNQIKYTNNPIAKNTKDNNFKNNKNKLKELIFNSVENKIESDVDIGSFLSSGIDSSTITAVMSKVSNKKIQTFSLGYDDNYFDESKQAKQIAKHLGTYHHNINFNLDHASDLVMNLSNLFCEPFSDSSQIPTLYLSKNTSKHVKVCFSGDGGDELFGGYNRYLNSKLIYDLYNNKRSLKGSMIKLMGSRKFDYFFNTLIKFNYLFPHNLKIHNMIQKSENIVDALKEKNIYDMYLSINQHWKFNDFTKNKIFFDPLKEYWNEEINYLDNIMSFDLNTYLPDDLLVKVDRSSMAYGLEVRNPFLDSKILDFVNCIPSNHKVNNSKGKIILRSVLEDLIPKNLIQNQKKGFLFPVKQILNKQLKTWAEKLIDKDSIKSHGFFDYDLILNEWNLLINNKLTNEYKIWDFLVFQDWYSKNFL